MSPTSAACTGSAVTITVTYTSLSGASTTITEPSPGATTKYVFASSATSESETCSGSSCSSYTVTNYYELYQEFNMEPVTPSTWDAGYTEGVTGAVAAVTSSPYASICSVTLSSGSGQSDCQGWVDYNRAFIMVQSWASTASDEVWGITWASYTQSPAAQGLSGTSGGTLFNATYSLETPTTDSLSTPASQTNEWYVPNTDSLLSILAGNGHYDSSTESVYGICANHTDNSVYCGSSYRIEVGGSGVSNLDCGQCLIADGKYYDFYTTINDTNGQNGIDIDLVEFAFNDGSGIVVFGYDNVTGVTEAIVGSQYVTVGGATVTSKHTAKGIQMYVSIPVALTSSIIDQGDVTLSVYAQLSDMSSIGFLPVKSGLIIINQGGATETAVSGDASVASSQGPFGCSVTVTEAGGPGNCDVNSSWYGLQWYSTQFSLYPTWGSNTSSFNVPTYVWQNPANSQGSDDNRYTVPGDWSLTISWYYWDGTTWVDGQHVVISLMVGNQGDDDEWTTLQTTYYDALGQVSTQSATCWIEQGTTTTGTVTGQVRLFVDMWFDKQNASTIEGARVGCYYTGMHKAATLWWGTWAPSVENGSASIALSPLYNSTDDIISSQTLLCSKIGFDLARSVTPGYHYLQWYDEYFTMNAQSFQIQKFQVASNPTNDMGGIATPSFTVAQIPTLPSSGFLSPLWAALASLAGLLWSAVSAGFASIWNGIGSRFPWFTAFWGDLYSGIVVFGAFFFSVFPILISGITFVFGFFSFFQPILTVLENSYSLFVSMFTWLGKNAVVMAEIAILWIFSMEVLDALDQGDWPRLFGWARQSWRIVYQIMFWVYQFASEIINQIIGLIP